MASLDTLQKIYNFCNKAADLVREAEGSTDPIPLNALRTRLAAASIAKFYIDDNHVLKGHRVVNGKTDSSTPEDTADYFRKLFTNFADKVRVGSNKLNIDQIEEQENLVCGVHKVDDDDKYGLTIPEGVIKIDPAAFNNTHRLTFINLPSSLTSIGRSAFDGCSSLTSITIPEGITEIDSETFKNCSKLTSISLPNNLVSIENNAFYGCSSLTSIMIPEGVATIGEHAFAYTSLSSITVDPRNTVFDSRDSCNAIIRTEYNSLVCGGTNTVIPSSVTDIGQDAFYGCTALTSITIPSSVTDISSGAFSECTSLASVTIPGSVTNIGGFAFRDCTSLTSITILDGVTSIDYYAFDGCSSLASITIPKSVTSIGTHAFRGCSPDIYIKYQGSVEDCRKAGDWSSVVDSSVEYVECSDGSYEIPHSGGGSGSGSGSSSGS